MDTSSPPQPSDRGAQRGTTASPRLRGGATAAPLLSGRTAGIVLAAILVADFMELLDATIVSVAAPAIAEDLGAGVAALQWMLAGYTLAAGAGLITGGRIGDQFGRRRVFLLGLAAFMLASAGCGLAPDSGVLIGMRVAQGLAAGLMIPQVFGIIRASFEPGARAKALGAYGAVLGLASVAGPLLGGVLVEADLFGLGWRAIFWVNVPIAIIALIVGVRFMPESRVPGNARLDLAGAVLAAAAVVLLLLPLMQGRDWGWPWWGFLILALSVPVTALFLIRQRRLVARGGQPILDPGLLRVRAFAGGLSASLLFFGALGSFFLLLSLYLQLGTGRTALETGLVILPYAVGSIITSGIGVQFAHRALLVSGSLVLAASQVALLLIVRGGAEPSYWALAAPLFVGGLGLGLTAPSLINVVLAGVPAKDAGAAGGVLTTVGQVGNALGVAVLGVVFFTRLESSLTGGGTGLIAYGDALATILPWQVACYIGAAALMLLLPKRANASHE
ncbi:MFS transporter [Streptosporangium roseum]|uniref:Membrane efflux protein n=1 Tax=Streptosporangium roseum (strain ATCC 12428 / DSM 43021 / JCM 3005 / KCTC 9067 / NCIMB 10171 / NRRL 2505 / NI 9100) TaxID=479432 RepID=D2BDL6_STRRD|nr:MFS transporter [Streptosporangium roseum]ACZ88108.1 membrane efflux protein [Streptosporangium roseum DSM 43021]